MKQSEVAQLKSPSSSNKGSLAVDNFKASVSHPYFNASRPMSPSVLSNRSALDDKS